MSGLSSFGNFSWLLINNPSLVAKLQTFYANNASYLPYVDSLCGQVRRGGVQKLQEKAEEVGDVKQFSSFVSELEFVKAFISHSKRVEMIPERLWKGGRRRPDMICSDNNWPRIFVEVERLVETEATEIIRKKLDQFVVQNPYDIVAELPLELSIPTTDPKKRQGQKMQAKQSVSAFISSFNQANSQVNYNSVIYQVSPVASGQSMGTAITINQYKGDVVMMRHLEFNAVDAAEKRKDWISSSDRTTPYLVCLEAEELGGIDQETIDQAFYGPLPPSCRVQPRSLDLLGLWKVLRAKINGWNQFFRNMGYVPFSNLCFPKRDAGVFMRNGSLFHASAVLVKEGNRFHFRPNPFCDPKMNKSKF